MYMSIISEIAKLTTWKPSNMRFIVGSSRIQPMMTATGKMHDRICILLPMVIEKLRGISSFMANLIAWMLQPKRGKRIRPTKFWVKTARWVRPSILSTAKVAQNPKKIVSITRVRLNVHQDIFGRSIGLGSRIGFSAETLPPAVAARVPPIKAKFSIVSPSIPGRKLRMGTLKCGVVYIYAWVLYAKQR